MGHSELEEMKRDSHGLYEPLAQELERGDPCFGKASAQILKHHGIYQQENRDRRIDESVLMVRTKLPGGRLTADQYLACDTLASKYGTNLRITSRQGIEFQGIHKADLRALIRALNAQAGITTFGAAGDVVRNTIAPPVADIDPRYRPWGTKLLELAGQIHRHFTPQTRAYHDLWLNGAKPTEPSPHEPLYGEAYLPRKLKVAIAAAFDNSVEALTNDVGLIAVTRDRRLEGYEVVVGGGLGYTPGNPRTYPRLASSFAFVSEVDAVPLLEAIVAVLRDHGNREDRACARLKYLVDAWGLDSFRERVFAYGGMAYKAPRHVTPTGSIDYLGWHRQIQPGLHYLGLWVEAGRIQDHANGPQVKTGLRAVLERFKLEVRLTASQGLILANIAARDARAVSKTLADSGMKEPCRISAIRRHEMACPSLPMCPRALAEAERALPGIMAALEAAGYGTADIAIRMSGCPNNCARARVAEIGIVGKGPGRYRLFAGGSRNGTRLNELVADNLPIEHIVPVIRALLDQWRAEGGGAFGDWVVRRHESALQKGCVGHAALL